MGTKGDDRVVARLRGENERLKAAVEDAQQQLHQCRQEKAMLQASYEEALTSLSDSEAKQETGARELKMAHEQMASLWTELEQIRKQIDGSATSNGIERLLPSGVAAIHVTAVDGGLQHPSSSPIMPRSRSDELELQCTLCKEKIKFSALESHSKQCATGNGTKSPKGKGKSPSPPTARSRGQSGSSSPALLRSPPPQDILVINVTRTPPGQSDLAPFKVITKTNLPFFVSSSFEVYRSQGDFQWLFDILCDSCPERIVPPLRPQISLHATMLEFQRFLARIGAHISLRKNHFVMAFLQTTTEEMKAMRAKNKPQKQPEGGSDAMYRPSQGRDTNSGSLVQTKSYLEAMEENLRGFLGLLSHDHLTRKEVSPSYVFKKMSSAEPNETYLKDATSNLGAICETLERSQGDSDEGLLKESVESLVDLVRAAQGLVRRIEDAVDKYLYWDEEVQLYEAVNASPMSETFSPSMEEIGEPGVAYDSGMSEASSSSAITQEQSMADSGVKALPHGESSYSISQKWAEATTNCQDAKDYLEMMCQDLTNELAQFDLLKERELKQILLAYVTAQLEAQEKSKSKWFSLTVILDTPIKPEVRAIQFKTAESEDSSQ